MSIDERKASGAAFWNANPCGGEWPTYREFLHWYMATEPYMYDVLRRHAWEGVSTLEVGCGQGTIANFLAPLGARMTALDMSRGSIERARAGAREMGHADRIAFVQSDAERLPFADETFDVGVSFGVLHHTPDTAGSVRELLRVVRPGGRAIVMLYRRGNPKWWATRTLRGVSRVVDMARGEQFSIARRLRARQETGAPVGTALLELFGVPVLKAFSNREARAMFAGCDQVRVTNHQPGFLRLTDVVHALTHARAVLDVLDRTTRDAWGFYQVIEVAKPKGRWAVVGA
jgi:SAM-dependent methyltransferase